MSMQAADRILLITEARQSANPALRLPASPRGAGSGAQSEFDAAAAVRGAAGSKGGIVHGYVLSRLQQSLPARSTAERPICHPIWRAASCRLSTAIHNLHPRTSLYVQAARPDLTLQHIKLPQQYIEAAYPLVGRFCTC